MRCGRGWGPPWVSWRVAALIRTGACQLSAMGAVVESCWGSAVCEVGCLGALLCDEQARRIRWCLRLCWQRGNIRRAGSTRFEFERAYAQGWLDRLLPEQAGWIRVHSHQLMTLPRRRPHTLSSFSPPHPVRRARVSSCLSAAEARPGGRSA